MHSLLNFPSLIPAAKVLRPHAPVPTPPAPAPTKPTPKPRAVSVPVSVPVTKPMPEFDDATPAFQHLHIAAPPDARTTPRPPMPMHVLPPPMPEPVAQTTTTTEPVIIQTARSTALSGVSKAKPGAGPLWVVCAHFNPGRFKKRCTNYQLFMENLLRQNVPVCTVELAASPESAELATMPISTAQNAAGTYQNMYHAVYSPSVLWAKEVLLNIGESLLPADCRFVCWADADLIWDDDNWATKAASLMSKPDGPVVIQPFEICHNMHPGETFEKDYKHLTGDERNKNACMPIGRQYAQNPVSYVNITEPFKYHAGFAWVIRRDVMNQMGGLFEYCILGQADYCMALAFTHNNERDRIIGKDWHIDATFNWGQQLLNTIREWQRRAAACVKGRLGYLNGVRVFHNFHGHPANRQYKSRGRLINDLNPAKDLVKDKNGMLCFTPAAEARGMPQRVIEYFKKRQEDSDENPNVRMRR